MARSGQYPGKSYRKNDHLPGDPYMNEKLSSGKVVCPRCYSFYINKRWHKDDKKLNNLLKDKEFKHSLCPACKKTKDKFPQGIVTLKGQFFAEHRDEILRLVANEEKKAVAFNPLDRIIEIKNNGSQAVISTTSEKLAQRIGKAVKRACNGTIRYSWSVENKMARVRWER